MGRDTSVVSSHECCPASQIRSIISSEDAALIDGSAAEVRFGLKPSKVFIFDKETEKRI